MTDKDFENDMSIIKISSGFCFFCGNKFTTSGNLKKTNHHAIPAFLKPERNIIVPVCIGCHSKINCYNIQSVPKMDAIKGLVDNLKDFVAKYEKVIERYEVRSG